MHTGKARMIRETLAYSAYNMRRKARSSSGSEGRRFSLRGGWAKVGEWNDRRRRAAETIRFLAARAGKPYSHNTRTRGAIG